MKHLISVSIKPAAAHLDVRHLGYGFANHKGYPVPELARDGGGHLVTAGGAKFVLRPTARVATKIDRILGSTA